jgi:hypothetical protein
MPSAKARQYACGSTAGGVHSGGRVLRDRPGWADRKRISKGKEGAQATIVDGSNDPQVAVLLVIPEAFEFHVIGGAGQCYNVRALLLPGKPFSQLVVARGPEFQELGPQHTPGFLVTHGSRLPTPRGCPTQRFATSPSDGRIVLRRHRCCPSQGMQWRQRRWRLEAPSRLRRHRYGGRRFGARQAAPIFRLSPPRTRLRLRFASRRSVSPGPLALAWNRLRRHIPLHAVAAPRCSRVFERPVRIVPMSDSCRITPTIADQPRRESLGRRACFLASGHPSPGPLRHRCHAGGRVEQNGPSYWA